jgi:hypothetical protein
VAEESRTRVCAACGFPAVATMRRCPFCRVASPRVRVPMSRRVRLPDPLTLLGIAWVALMIPAALLTLAAVGAPLALVALAISVAPAGCVWLLRGRTLARVRRLNRRAGRARSLPSRSEPGTTTGSEQPPSDAMRR